MTSKKSNLKMEEIELLESACKGFLSDLLYETDFGSVWKFNCMKLDLGPNSEFPKNVIADFQVFLSIY